MMIIPLLALVIAQQPTPPSAAAVDAAAPAPAAAVVDAPANAAVEAPKAKRLLRVAVYDIESQDFEKRITSVVTEALLAEIRKLEGVSVVGLDEVRALLELEANRQLAGCSDASCLAEVAGALGADEVVIATVAKVGDGTVFGARRLSQRTAQVGGQVSKRLADADGEELIAGIGPVVEELFPDIPLRAGMARGADPELALRVHPPPLSPVVFWGVVLTTGAVGATTMMVGAVNVVSANKYAGRTEPTQGKDVVANDQFVLVSGIVTWAGVAATTVGAASAAVIGLFLTDWLGYGDSPAE